MRHVTVAIVRVVVVHASVMFPIKRSSSCLCILVLGFYPILLVKVRREVLFGFLIHVSEGRCEDYEVQLTIRYLCIVPIIPKSFFVVVLIFKKLVSSCLE